MQFFPVNYYDSYESTNTPLYLTLLEQYLSIHRKARKERQKEVERKGLS